MVEVGWNLIEYFGCNFWFILVMKSFVNGFCVGEVLWGCGFGDGLWMDEDGFYYVVF